jgi:hypothetical protein
MMGPNGDLRAQIERIFEERAWDNLDDLDTWDGEEIEALREFLSDEQFEALLDELADTGAYDR